MKETRKEKSISVMRPLHFASYILKGAFGAVSSRKHWQIAPLLDGAHQSVFSQIADIAYKSPRRYFLPLIGAYQAMKSNLYHAAKE